MKGFGAGAAEGRILPLWVALSPVQCIHYALTRPAVASVLVGCRTPEEVAKAAAYEQASPEERDYSAILASTLQILPTGEMHVLQPLSALSGGD